MIRNTVLKTEGAAGPSGLDAVPQWHGNACAHPSSQHSLTSVIPWPPQQEEFAAPT